MCIPCFWQTALAVPEKSDKETTGGDPGDDAMLVLHQFKQGDDRVRVTTEMIIIGWSEAVIEYGLDTEEPKVPIQPKEGVGSDGLYGDYYVYARWEQIAKFADAVPVVEINVGGTPVQLYAEAVNLVSGNAAKPKGAKAVKTKYTRDQIDSLFVHVSTHIPNGEDFHKLNHNAYRAAWQEAGFFVARADRQKTTVNGKATAIKADVLHANVRPLDGTIRGARFPAKVRLPVKVFKQDGQHDVEHIDLDYTIHPHPALEDGRGGFILCTKSCHMYKQDYMESTGMPGDPCGCRDGSDQSNKARKRAMRAGEYEEKMRETMAASTANKEAILCPHYERGVCSGVRTGARCGFKHSDVPPETIPCNHPLKKGACFWGTKCMYGPRADGRPNGKETAP